jgi:hypothetical protein
MDVTDKSSASIRFVTYTDELPVTPTVTNPTPSSNTTNKAIVDQLLLNQITNQMLRDGIKRQNQITWGNDNAPSDADFWTGAIGCKSDPFRHLAVQELQRLLNRDARGRERVRQLRLRRASILSSIPSMCTREQHR